MYVYIVLAAEIKNTILSALWSHKLNNLTYVYHPRMRRPAIED
jgi:hypothetical protein